MNGVNFMNNMIEMSNSLFMYLISGIIILSVVIVCALFFTKAYKEGIKIGMNKSDLKKVITSSAVFTVIPSVGILLGVITLSGSLGVPIPWLRLSVIGALHYEIMAADMAAKASGLSALSPEFMTPEILVTIVFVMAIGIIWGGVFCIVGLKKYQKTLKKSTSSDNRWGQILFNAIFIGLVCAFIGTAFADVKVGSFTSLIVIIVSALCMSICDYLVKNKNLKWLDSFSLSISMIMGMAMAVLVG
jgi:hypothetical protein